MCVACMTALICSRAVQGNLSNVGHTCSKVSYIERCPHFRGKFLVRKHIWDVAKCPCFRVYFKRGSAVMCMCSCHIICPLSKR